MKDSTKPSFAKPSDSCQSTLDHLQRIARKREALDAAFSGTLDALLAAVSREAPSWAPATLLEVYELVRGQSNGASTRYANAAGVPISQLTNWRLYGAPEARAGQHHIGVFPISYQMVPPKGTPTVYLLLYDTEVVYIGKSAYVKARLKTHWLKKVKNIDAWEVICCPDEATAGQLEADLIYQHQPHYNVVGRRARMYVA